MFHLFAVMDSFRKWFYKPRRDDTSYLAQFFYADEALNLVAAELDSFDGRKDPERCTTLVSHLRQCQDKVLNICSRIMDEMIPNERADRDFRVKFPDDVMQDNLAGQLWFGAECLAAGSSIMNREIESVVMRPLAKALTKSLEEVRGLLREAALRTPHGAQGCHLLYSDPVHADRLIEALKIFDRLLAQFELSYVSAMVPVKTALEYEIQQCVVVLFSETLQRALEMGLLSQDQVDQCDPALMFTIPRLAIVAGLLIFPHGPLSLTSPDILPDMFRPFRQLLLKIRELLWTLSESELLTLEKMLCSSEDPSSQVKPCPIPSPTIFRCEEEETSRWEVKGVDGEGSSRWSLRTIPCDCSQSQQNSSTETVTNEKSHITTDRPIQLSGANMTDKFNDNLQNNNLSRNSSQEWDNQPSNVFPNSKSTSISVPSHYKENNRSSSCLICTDSNGSPVSNSCSISSSDTSSYNSDYQDEMEVALAVRAAEFSCSREARAKFKSSEDLLQRLFVCISGVADQLQTNFAGDLRNILKAVFLINASDRTQFDTADTRTTSEYCEQGEDVAGALNASPGGAGPVNSHSSNDDEWHSTIAPAWLPDEEAPACMACRASFTVIRRRHHCRNCGKIFCARCSSNSVPLPKFGHMKPVRVCNRCFIYQVTPFTLDPEIHTAAAN